MKTNKKKKEKTQDVMNREKEKYSKGENVAKMKKPSSKNK